MVTAQENQAQTSTQAPGLRWARYGSLLGWLWRGTSSRPGDQLVILGASALAVILVLCCFQISFNSDSISYVTNARILTGQQAPGTGDSFRTPGYPTLLALTGVAGGDTFYGLLAAQAVMGLLIPWLIYWAMIGIDQRLAFRTALLSVFTLVPYLFVKDVMTEQTYLFIQFLALCAAARFLCTHRIRYVYLMTGALLLLAFTRPSGNLLCVLFLGVAVLRVPRQWVHCLAALVLMVGGLKGGAYLQDKWFGSTVAGATGKVAFSAVITPSTYLCSVSTRGPLPGAIREENGPWSRLLVARLSERLGPEKTRAMLASPHRDAYGVCWTEMDQAVGPAEADQILGNATWEALREQPHVSAIYLKNLIDFFVGFPPAATWLPEAPGSSILFPHIPFNYRPYGYPTGEEILSPRMRQELDHAPLRGRAARASLAFCDKYYGLGYTAVKCLTLAVLLMTLPFLWTSRHRLFMLLCLGIIVYQALVVSVFAMAAFRYHVPVMLVQVMLVMCGIHVALARRHRLAPGTHEGFVPGAWRETESLGISAMGLTPTPTSAPTTLGSTAPPSVAFAAAAPLDLTLFVACYNEEDNICATLDSVVGAMGEVSCSYEIIVIDDASRDQSAAKVRQYIQEHPNLPILLRVNPVNQGLARNFIDCAFLGRGKHFKLVCGDNVESQASLVRVIRQIGTADLLLQYYEECPGKSWLRIHLSLLFTRMVNLIGGHSIRYYNGCGVYQRYHVMRWQASTSGLGFQADLVTRLLTQGVSYREVEMSVSERQQGSSSALSIRNVFSAAHCLIGLACRRLHRALSPSRF